jgi:serine/threonine protein kinase
MTPERWQRVKELFEETQSVAEDAREALLRRLCGEDAELLAEVSSLLAAQASMGPFLATGGPAPVAEGGAPAALTALDPGLAGLRLGAYQILRRVARGGMGEVYLAARGDDAFEKRVAVKVIRTDVDLGLVLQRFHEERQILARLEHPHIARLLDGGTTPDGRPFFVMEYVDGEPLREYCDERRLSVRRRLELFLSVCGAVHYAHQNLIVHRDLKPGNILVTAEGVPKLLDFGIAKLLRPDTAPADAQATITVMRLLTPDYASPEQARGEPVTTATDVYSLGVLLYELLTGHRPHGLRGQSPEEVLAAVREEAPTAPSEVIRRPETAPAVAGGRRRRWRPSRPGARRGRSSSAASWPATSTPSCSWPCARSPPGATAPWSSSPTTSAGTSPGGPCARGPTPSRTARASSCGAIASRWPPPPSSS